jgi:hypothetical protein
MAYVTVDVDVYLDEFDNDELVEELKARGYHVQDEPFEDNKLDKFELDFLLDLVDKNNKDVYTNRVRDKLHKLRHR